MTSHRALVFVAVVCSVASVAGAGAETFTLDPVASTLTVSGTLLGQPFVAQNPGSLTTGYTGTFAIERVGDAFTLTSDTPDALNQLLPQRPGRNTSGAEAANYGLMRPGAATEPLLGAIQQMNVYVSTAFGPPVSLGAGGTFDPAAIGMFVSDGALFWYTSGTSNEVDLHGTGAPNAAAALGSLVSAGGVETFTLPIRLTAVRDVRTPGDTVLTFDGQFVATRVVPEPGGVIWITAGAVMVLGRRGRGWSGRSLASL